MCKSPSSSIKVASPSFFIIGAQRSGTTMLRLLLNSHTKIAIPEEGTFWMPLLREQNTSFNKPIPKGKLIKYCSYIENNYTYQAWKMPQGLLEQYLQTSRENSLRDIMEYLYSKYAERHNKELAGDKSPSFFRKITLLNKIFPDAKFIHIIRDGRDVYVSRREKEKDKKNIAIGSFEWMYKVECAERQLKALNDKVLRVRFEDIVKDGVNLLQKICEFIGVEFEESMLEYYKTAHEFIGRHHSNRIFKPLDSYACGRWKRALPYSDVWIFESISKTTLKKFDYPLFCRNKKNVMLYGKKLLLL